MRACALVPNSDGSRRSEELLQRAAWRRWIAEYGLGQDQPDGRPFERRQSGRNCCRGPARHAEKAAIHALIVRRAAVVRGRAVGAALMRHGVRRDGRGGLHRAVRHGDGPGNAARRKGESRQKGQPDLAHAIVILVRRGDFVNATHRSCEELTTQSGVLTAGPSYRENSL